jgi:signal transduction histidine kinase
LKDEAILGSIGESVIAMDSTSKVVFANPAALELFKKPANEILNKNLLDILPLADKAGELVSAEHRPIKIALQFKKKVVTSDYYFFTQDQKFPISITATPIILDDAVIGAIQVIRDISKEREVDKAKTEFVSLASHQLRTPLSAINWYAEMLLAGDAGKLNTEQEKYLKEVYAGNQRMVELVNALLNVSRLDLGTFIIEPKPTDVLELAKSVLNELQPQIKQKQLVIKENFGENIPQFQADEKLLRMVFQNLLSNSVKYTLPKGTVKVDVTVIIKDKTFGDKKTIRDSLAISVSDSGMGIPREQQAKIFTKLFRADNVMETETEGTGLGLYIVKSIIDQSGGEIWFESEQNKGTEFCILFPLSGMVSKEGSKKLE